MSMKQKQMIQAWLNPPRQVSSNTSADPNAIRRDLTNMLSRREAARIVRRHSDCIRVFPSCFAPKELATRSLTARRISVHHDWPS
jgi:hypothetical protein